MTDAPFFSVVTATFGRGAHIRPTIEAALQQTFRDFELIVVGDGCVDDTEEVVRGIQSERLRWVNVPLNSGSQSLPNNVGIRLARGNYIAYLGHDDIWAPDHLEALHRLAVSEQFDFIVSGCVYHGPPESDFELVTGLFDDPQAPSLHFFPPTSLAHRRDVSERIGGWKEPRTISAPVDSEFLVRAAQSGMRFVSTSRVTAHKFAAGHRYLSYLRVRSDEQWEMLRKLCSPGEVDTDAMVEASKRQGRFMSALHPDSATLRPGEMFERNRRNKGLSRPALRTFATRVEIEQGPDDRALDWYPREGHGEGKWFRWSGPNPHPKILIPFTGGKVGIGLEIVFACPGAEPPVVTVEGETVATRIEQDGGGINWLFAEIPLRADDYTVLTLDAPTFRPVDLGWNDDTRRLGVGIGRMVIEPVRAKP